MDCEIIKERELLHKQFLDMMKIYLDDGFQNHYLGSVVKMQQFRSGFETTPKTIFLWVVLLGQQPMKRNFQVLLTILKTIFQKPHKMNKLCTKLIKNLSQLHHHGSCFFAQILQTASSRSVAMSEHAYHHNPRSFVNKYILILFVLIYKNILLKICPP